MSHMADLLKEINGEYAVRGIELEIGKIVKFSGSYVDMVYADSSSRRASQRRVFIRDLLDNYTTFATMEEAKTHVEHMSWVLTD